MLESCSLYKEGQVICLTYDFLLIPTQLIGRFTVVCLVPWPFIGSEGEGDHVLI